MTARQTRRTRQLHLSIIQHEGLVLSDATLRAEDLIPCFTSLLDAYAPTRARIIKRAYRDIYQALERSPQQLPDALQEDAAYLLNEELWDALADLAPSGYTLGSHPGDGACVGYFSVEMFD